MQSIEVGDMSGAGSESDGDSDATAASYEKPPGRPTEHPVTKPRPMPKQETPAKPPAPTLQLAKLASLSPTSAPPSPMARDAGPPDPPAPVVRARCPCVPRHALGRR